MKKQLLALALAVTLAGNATAMTSPVTSQAAGEDNSSLGSAIEMPLNTLTTATFTGEDDETKYYKVVMPDNGNTDVTVSLSNSSSDKVKLNILDSNGVYITDINADSQDSSSLTFKAEGSSYNNNFFYTQGTTYFIRLEPEIFRTTGEVYCNVATTTDDSWGTLTKADTVSLNEIHYGKIEVCYDADAYKFILPNDGKTYNIYGTVNGSLTNVILKDSLGKELRSLESGILEGYNFSWTLTGDGNTYYISFYNNYHTDNYNFTIAEEKPASAVSNKTDSNSTSATNKLITPLKTQTITTKKIKTFKAKKLKKKAAKFSLGAKTSGDGALSYKVTKGSKKYITVSSAGKVTLKKKCKKGTYKIKITAKTTNTYFRATKTVSIKVN